MHAAIRWPFAATRDFGPDARDAARRWAMAAEPRCALQPAASPRLMLRFAGWRNTHGQTQHRSFRSREEEEGLVRAARAGVAHGQHVDAGVVVAAGRERSKQLACAKQL